MLMDLWLARAVLLYDGSPTPISLLCVCVSFYVGTIFKSYKALLVSLINRLFQLGFLAGIMFFSHNKSTETAFRLIFLAKRTGPSVNTLGRREYTVKSNHMKKVFLNEKTHEKGEA